MTPRNIGVTHYRSNSEPAELTSPMQWLADQNQLQRLGNALSAIGLNCVLLKVGWVSLTFFSYSTTERWGDHPACHALSHTTRDGRT